MFHPLSLIIPLLILLPNLLFLRWPPRGRPAADQAPKESLLLKASEGAGQLGVMAAPLFFSIQLESAYEAVSLTGMLLCLLFYYLGWVRFFTGNREYRLLFAPMLGIPAPMAIFPVVYFMLAAAVLGSGYMLLFSLILAAGHIPISLRTSRTCP
ncbi:MAG: hypothetical protein K0R57_6132 [Paenibacillaceae bacterium]|nr:hypothetical protein [Paenibacillaceae bacterium]